MCLSQEVCQTVELLKPRLMALCSATKRLGEGSQLEEEVANLQKQQRELMEKASKKKSMLESLLALWQRYNKLQNVVAFVLDQGCQAHVVWRATSTLC